MASHCRRSSCTVTARAGETLAAAATPPAAQISTFTSPRSIPRFLLALLAHERRIKIVGGLLRRKHRTLRSCPTKRPGRMSRSAPAFPEYYRLASETLPTPERPTA